MKRPKLVILTFFVLAGAVGHEAWAIPAFARKYQTSCQTCHVAYPKLNSYGEAFRLLGYHLPGETEEQIKQPEILLGSEAYKRVWPKAVWPGKIPPSVPLAIATNFLWEDSSSEGGENVENDFMFPQAVDLIAGGTAGDHVSYFGMITFSREVEDGELKSELEVDHVDLRLIRPIKNSTAFNAKIGSFQPELVNTFDHARRLTVGNYESMFGVAVANPGGVESVGGARAFGLPAVVEGFEGYGIVKGRFFWTAGVVNGIGPGESSFDGNAAKDVYGRVAYKWGGLALDGSNAATYAGSSKNWRETSFQLGLLSYRGDGKDIFLGLAEGDAAFVEDGDFTRYGFDFKLYYKDLNVFGAYIAGEDDLTAFASDEAGVPGPIIPELSGTFDYTSWFVEADLVLGYPWLIGAARYENVDFSDRSDREQATISMTGLIRANVKTTLEYSWDLNEPSNYFAWVNLGIAF